MDPRCLIPPCLLLMISTCVVSEGPIGSSVIDCSTGGSEKNVGQVDEGYSGDVEFVGGIEAGVGVKLVSDIFTDHLEFLELSFNIGDINATVRTKKPLDADALPGSDRVLYYAIMCDGESKYLNTRRLTVRDLNDNRPIFTQEVYVQDVSEALSVGKEVLRVKAVDGDSTPENSRVTYSTEPTPEDFTVTSSGAFILKKPLNYNLVDEYSFTMTARDNSGLNDTARVLIHVTDFDNLNPYFVHSLYYASIPEGQILTFPAVEPEPIKALDGDRGINMNLTYSISRVSPEEYMSSLGIDPTSGFLTLRTPIDREAMNSSVITVFIKAAQNDDSLKTADAAVLVTVEDMNDNPPQFKQSNYSVTLQENSPVDAFVFKAVVTDRDQGGFVGTLNIVPESAPFSIGSDGTVRVRNAAALDRETTSKFTFQIEAKEKPPSDHVTLAQVTVTLLDENDNSPVFTSKAYEGKVFSNQTEGILLQQVKAEDPDAGRNGKIEYFIEFGNSEGFFTMGNNSGEIRLAKIIPLEDNRILEFPLYVAARDGGVIPHSASAMVTISAHGSFKPNFLHKIYNGTVEEEQLPGVMILKVSFFAIPSEVNVTLQVLTDADKFSISSKGEFTTKVKLDYDDAPHNYSVNISISDGVNSDRAVVEVRVKDVNDNSPAFNSSSFTITVPEDAEVATNVTQITATDKDSGSNKEIRYFLRGGGGRFAVDPVSGTVSVAAALDRETEAEYSMLVVAEDQGRPANTGTASLLVQVSDVNDNVPEFSETEYQVEVLETESAGKILLTLSAVDPDGGTNGRVSYSIYRQSPSSEAAVFEVNSTTGTLKLVQPLDYSVVKVYSLLVQASDGGSPSLVGNSSVVVKVKDVNNNRPVFSRESYDAAVSENLANGASVLTLEVTDLDEGGFVGTLRVVEESAPFSVGSDGTIRVKNSSALDRETTKGFVFQVEANETSPPHHVALAYVNITLLDENDNIPEFTSSKYEATVLTNQTEGALLVKVEAVDPDEGVNGQIKYSIEFGNQENYFSINEDTGAITLVKKIPSPQTLEFSLFVTARDGGVLSLSDSAQVVILAIGDTKPKFTQSTYRGTIEEESGPGTRILMVGFLPTGQVNVTLQVLTDADKFSISSKGEFTTKVKLDYDDAPHNYSVNISISDGVNSDRAVVEVRVKDVNDNSPVFNSSSFTITVPEDAEVATNVTQITATDKDSGSNKEIRYFLRGGGGRFAVDPVSGTVSVAAALDRETEAEYSMLVVAEDQGRPANSGTASLLVQVSDVNDNVPEFSETEYQVEVLETESAGKILLTLSAVDPDGGTNGRVTYSIYRQSPSSEAAVFEVNSTTGTLKLVQPLDYSVVKVYSLLVQASDGGSPSLVGNSSVVVKVKDVNNNRPVFSRESYDAAVSENLANGASVLTLEVTDLDEGGFVGTLRVVEESAPFSVGSDGTIRVKNSSALDRETTKGFVFQVEANETSPPHHVALAYVNITLLDENDNIPEFTSSKYEATVLTNQTEGALLVKVEAVDPDEGVNGQIKYSIEFGNQENYFSINEDTGAITLVKKVPSPQTLEFSLFVTARDGGVLSLSDSAQVVILAIGDTKPKFTQSTYRGTIEEESGPGTRILMVGFLPTGQVNVTLQVLTDADKFSISSKGEFTTKVKLDYDDAPHNYSVNISISDEVSSDRAVVEVRVKDVNDNSPVFNSSSFTITVPEDAEVATNVTQITATDKDSGSNKEIRYFLRGGGGRFAVDPVSGTVSVAAALDRETEAEYSMLVVAEDQGRPANTGTASLLVQVSDVNDNVPEFSETEYQVEVLETESAGKILLTLSAVDPDGGTNGRVTYSIYRQSPSPEAAVFEVNSTTGTLKLVQPLDYSVVKVYSLLVQASDGGSPSLVGNSSVVVKVKDVNNNRPVFSRESYDAAVSENLASGASILTLEVTDLDEGGFSDGHFVYPGDTFDINNQGVVSLRKDATLDRETKDRYVFKVMAVDKVIDGLTATAQINITVLDYNDNAPQFPAIPARLPIPEGNYSEKNPGEVFTIVPTDLDLGLNAVVTLSLSPPNPLFRFREDGTLLAVGLLDRESKETYELVVKASDGGRPQRESVTTVTVSITDVNDNKPQFSSSLYESTVLLKDAAAGKAVLKLIASDRDAGKNSLVSYSFSAGSSPYLSLRSDTGVVTLTSDLADVTVDTTLRLTAVAQDHGAPPLSSTVPVVIYLRLVSLVEGVAFRSPSYNFSLAENEPAGAVVGVVSASAGSDHYDVAYSLTSDQFSVNASGTIQTKMQLDREQQWWYVLDVTAVDTRTPPTTALAVVTVQVEDLNEPPKFLLSQYKASVLSIAPYKTPVVRVKASDPDVGDAGQLVYSLSPDSRYFDVDRSSGLLYVVSAAGLSGKVELEVKAEDPKGLHATTKVEVEVRGSASGSDVVIISLNQPANIVEEKVPQIESSLGSVLGWTVDVIEVSSSDGEASESRSLRVEVKTLVSLIALDGEAVVPSEELKKKLQSQSAKVRAELVKVFGDSLHFDVEAEPESDQTVVIVLGVMLALSMLGLIVTTALIIWFKKTQNREDSDDERFDLPKSAVGYTNWSQNTSEQSEQGPTTEERKRDDSEGQTSAL